MGSPQGKHVHKLCSGGKACLSELQQNVLDGLRALEGETDAAMGVGGTFWLFRRRTWPRGRGWGGARPGPVTRSLLKD